MTVDRHLTAAIALCVLFAFRQLVSAQVLRAAPRQPAQRLGGRGVLIFLWVGYVGLVALALVDATRNGMTAPRWVQLLVLLLGSGLRTLALAKIRSYYWPSIALFANQRVVCEGPYRLFAHPLYLGLAVESAALAALSGRVTAVLVALALVVAMQVQVRREEVVLEQRFGETYRGYREATFDIGDLFPRPWRRGEAAGAQTQPSRSQLRRRPPVTP